MTTKKDAAKQTAEIIRDAWTDEGQARTIGINTDGEVDYWYESDNNMADCAFVIDDQVGNEWKYGDIDGDPSGLDSWTPEYMKALADCFENDWLNSVEDEDGNQPDWT